MSTETWEEMHLNATDGILVQKSVKVDFQLFDKKDKELYIFYIDSSPREACASLMRKWTLI